MCGGYNGSKVDNCTLYLRSLVLYNLMPASQYLYPALNLTNPLQPNLVSTPTPDPTSIGSIPLPVSLGNYSSLLWAFAIMRNSTFDKSSWPIQLNNITMVLPPVELQVSTLCIHIKWYITEYEMVISIKTHPHRRLLNPHTYLSSHQIIRTLLRTGNLSFLPSIDPTAGSLLLDRLQANKVGAQNTIMQ